MRTLNQALDHVLLLEKSAEDNKIQPESIIGTLY